MVDRTRALWKRQTALSREQLDMPAYDVMPELAPEEASCATAVVSPSRQQISKLVVHAPSDPGMLSYITQHQVTSPNSIQSPTAIRAGWASQLLSPKKTSFDETVPPQKMHGRVHHHTTPTKLGAGAHRRMGTWSHVSANLQGTVRHERSGSGGMMISGPQESSGSPRQACGYEVPGPTSAWLPTPLATAAQTSQPNEADNLISWDEPQTCNGDAVKSQVFGWPHASLANSAWARSMLGPAQVTEQQGVVEAKAGSLGEWSTLQQSPQELPQELPQQLLYDSSRSQPEGLCLQEPHQSHNTAFMHEKQQQQQRKPLQGQQQQAGHNQKTPLALDILQQLSQQLASCQADSIPSSSSGSLEGSALVSQGEQRDCDDAAAALPQRLPAFTQPRGPLVPEHSFEANAVW
ncbi:TPA: hypothetical protein ACH3X1_009036 [Trebouxia sp. C0004]